MTRLAWATDLHLNLCEPPAVAAFAEAVRRAACDALLVTGDLADAPSLETWLAHLAGAVGRPLYFVLGNHDYYHASFGAVRARMRALAGTPGLIWIEEAAGALPLGATTGLVGHGGWGDGRFGTMDRSRVVLNDFLRIEDLIAQDSAARRQKLAQLGDAAAAHLARVLPAALARYERVLVATHVPPFREVSFYDGKPSSAEYLPYFTCKAVGDLLLSVAAAFPHRRISVLCGHAHGAAWAQLAPNLDARAGAVTYGSPALQAVLELP